VWFLPILFVSTVSHGAQRGASTTPTPLVEPSLYGPDIYRFYCAACHGTTGRGDGPVAASLKIVPADLTKLAARAGGVFPRARVEAVVTHGSESKSPAHGTSAMPLWGPTFRALGASEPFVRERIRNVVAFVESLQVK
jgi:mono/diheme cytochrome c family protein